MDIEVGDIVVAISGNVFRVSHLNEDRKHDYITVTEISGHEHYMDYAKDELFLIEKKNGDPVELRVQVTNQDQAVHLQRLCYRYDFEWHRGKVKWVSLSLHGYGITILPKKQGLKGALPKYPKQKMIEFEGNWEVIEAYLEYHAGSGDDRQFSEPRPEDPEWRAMLRDYINDPPAVEPHEDGPFKQLGFDSTFVGSDKHVLLLLDHIDDLEAERDELLDDAVKWAQLYVERNSDQ